MTDRAVAVQKLATLREPLARLRRRRPATAEALRADVDLADAVGLGRLDAVPGALDIAFHVAADEGWGVPRSNAESFETPAAHGAIGRDLAHRLAGTAALRNRIAHGYATIDAERLWAELPAGLDALEAFAAAMARLAGAAG